MLIINFAMLTVIFSFQHEHSICTQSNNKNCQFKSTDSIKDDKTLRNVISEGYSKPIKDILSIRGGDVFVEYISSLEKYSKGISLQGFKIILQLMLTTFNILCWAIPLHNNKISGNQSIMGLANAFSGGIFLMLSFGHMIPHSLEIFESIGVTRDRTFQFTVVGYLLVLFLEKILFNSHSLLHSVMDHNHSHGHGHGHGHSKEIATNHNSHNHNHEQTNLDDCNICEEEHTSKSLDLKKTLSPRSAILLLLAMSLHSLFETMALGLASDKSSATMMAASVCLHQPAESIALLVAFLKTSLSRNAVIRWLTLFSAVGPLGVSLGVLISKISSPYASAVIVSLTAGTFLYMGATEIVGEEFEDAKGSEKWKKFISMLSGIALILGVTHLTAGWEHHGHSHSHSHHGHADHLH